MLAGIIRLFELYIFLFFYFCGKARLGVDVVCAQSAAIQLGVHDTR